MLPNLLTILRIIAAPLIVIILLSDQKHMIVIGLIIFILASITDFLDGYLARLFNQSSMMGKILDPIADKLLITCALISLLSNGIVKDFHIVAATLLIIRELFVSGLREYVQDKSLSVTTIAKIKTSAQMIAIIAVRVLLRAADTPLTELVPVVRGEEDEAVNRDELGMANHRWSS